MSPEVASVAPYILPGGIVALFVVTLARGFRDNHRASERLARRRERRIDRVDQRMIALNHRDVAERSRGRTFAAWDADEQLADVLPFERAALAPVIPLRDDLMDHDGLGAA